MTADALRFVPAFIFGAILLAGFAIGIVNMIRSEDRLDIPGEDANLILNYGWSPWD